MGGRERLSVVCPAYNERDNVSAVYEALTPLLDTCSGNWELLLVDDGSTDDTFAQMESLHDRDPRVKGIRFSRNFGKEAAIRAGIKAASGDAIIVMDIDLQHPPETIPEMVTLWRTGDYDVVDCVKKERGEESIVYRFAAATFYRALSALSGVDMAGATDFKLLDRKIVDLWLRMPETRTFYRGMVEWLGFRHAKVTIDVAERVAGRPSWSVPALVRLALTGMTTFTSMPLHLVTILGFTMIVLSVLFGIYTCALWMMGGSVEGFSTVILLQLISSGCTMLSLGIIGEYLGTIYHETKHRPRFVVESTLGIKEDVRD